MVFRLQSHCPFQLHHFYFKKRKKERKSLNLLFKHIYSFYLMAKRTHQTQNSTISLTRLISTSYTRIESSDWVHPITPSEPAAQIGGMTSNRFPPFLMPSIPSSQAFRNQRRGKAHQDTSLLIRQNEIPDIRLLSS